MVSYYSIFPYYKYTTFQSYNQGIWRFKVVWNACTAVFSAEASELVKPSPMKENANSLREYPVVPFIPPK